MVFTPTTLFKDTSCPVGDACELLNCIFAHVKPSAAVASETAIVTATNTSDRERSSSVRRLDASESIADESPAKRRKIAYDTLAEKRTSKADSIRIELAKAKGEVAQRKSETAVRESQDACPLPSTTRAISPPAKKRSSTTEQPVCSRLEQLTNEPAETLNPRIVTPSPDSHSKRTQIVQYLHADMSRLNRSVKNTTKPINGLLSGQLQAYILSDAVLIKLALSEEETIARQSSKVYQNVIRNRIATFKKMSPEAWLEYLRDALYPAELVLNETLPLELQAIRTTILSRPAAELNAHLKRLAVKDTAALERHGYIMSPPAAEAVEQQRLEVEAAGNWESCERCTTRFRVFPDRDPETGLLTSHGPCTYHWGRPVYATRSKTDAYTGNGSPTYRCCGQAVGAPGCTTHIEHVYKASSPTRLAHVLPFINTPVNKRRRRMTFAGTYIAGVVFDCEMAYTTKGMELVRLTAINFKDGLPLLDLLVRPLGTVIDFNTRFSGIKAEMYTTTQAHDDKTETGALRLVDSPVKARSLLLQYLTNDTPLMGHALENDLNAVRLCHQTIIDTVDLYPHPKGLPLRYGLKHLTKEYIGMDIQQGGSEGHDSFEDAVATRDLIARKIVRDCGMLEC